MVKNPPASAGDMRDTGLIPGSGRSHGGGHGNPFQYSCLEKPQGWRNLADGATPRMEEPGRTCSRTRLKQLSTQEVVKLKLGEKPESIKWLWITVSLGQAQFFQTQLSHIMVFLKKREERLKIIAEVVPVTEKSEVTGHSLYVSKLWSWSNSHKPSFCKFTTCKPKIIIVKELIAIDKILLKTSLRNLENNATTCELPKLSSNSQEIKLFDPHASLKLKILTSETDPWNSPGQTFHASHK